MIQDISPLKLDNHYSPDVKPEQDSIRDRHNISFQKQ